MKENAHQSLFFDELLGSFEQETVLKRKAFKKMVFVHGVIQTMLGLSSHMECAAFKEDFKWLVIGVAAPT